MADVKKISLDEQSPRAYQASMTECSEFPDRVDMDHLQSSPLPIVSHPPRTFGSNQVRERFTDHHYIARAM